MARVLILGLVVVAVFTGILIWAVRLAASPFTACRRCNGEGHWEGSRRRETCDVCRGTGKVRKPGR